MPDDFIAMMGRLGGAAFLPARKLAGPLHRRRPSLEHDQNDSLPSLPAPWHDERWFRGGFSPHQHNHLTPLIHGKEYFHDLYAMLLTARTRVTICGWAITPLMPLLRDGSPTSAILADVLREVSEQAEVYVLLWSGAPALFQPTHHAVEGARRTLREIAPRVRCVADHRAPFSHDHHQKAVTIDGRVAYVGGMDLSTFQGDRWDTDVHPLRFGPGWHDVQVRVEGEAVRDVEENFCQRWNDVTREQLRPLPVVAPRSDWKTTAQVVRTVPKGFYSFAPDGEYGIYHSLTTAIRKAERFVYLENQYIWAPEILNALAETINRPRSHPFRVVLILPARAYSGRYDNDEHVKMLWKIDGGRGIVHAYSLWAGGPAAGPSGYRYLPIYVHAKVTVVDDEWFSIGSANLNRRGLATDTEMNVQSIAPEVARQLRIRLWSEHLGMSHEQVAASNPLDLIDGAWRETAAKLERCARSAGPPSAGQIRTYAPGRNLPSRMLDLVQSATLEH